MKSFRLSAAILLAVFVLSLSAFAQSESTQPVFTVLTPRNGQVLQGGSRVTVTWDLTVDQSILNNPWGELELFLVDASGMSMRITPELNIRATSFDWVVPKLSTRSAQLVLQFGVAGEGELSRLTQTGTFSIKSVSPGGIIGIELPQNVRPGSDMDIAWTSDLMNGVNTFDVMVSYDRGGHFFRAGTTTESHYAFHVDEDFNGSITVKIVGHVGDRVVSSTLTRNATILVKGE